MDTTIATPSPCEETILLSVESLGPQEVPEGLAKMSSTNAVDCNPCVGGGLPKTTDASFLLAPDKVICNNKTTNSNASSCGGGSNTNHNNSATDNNNEDDMGSPRKGRWTLDEKVLFLHGLKVYGKGRWKKISIFLPHRSLVQIKSHAQKVLKRQDAGENVYRRLDEHSSRLEDLVKAVFEEQGIRADHMIPQLQQALRKQQCRGAALKKQKQQQQQQQQQNFHLPSDAPHERFSFYSHSYSRTKKADRTSCSTAVAAAALCQLSCTETTKITNSRRKPTPKTTIAEASASTDATATTEGNATNNTILSRKQAFFPVDPDPALCPRQRNVVSP